MTDSAEVLAWRSGQGAGDLYTAAELREADNVKEVFAACKAAEGYITADGWAFLVSTWQLEGLLNLDSAIGWFHSGKPEEATAHLVYQSLMAGYYPISGEKGDYESDSGLFLSHEGRKYKIDWDAIRGKDI